MAENDRRKMKYQKLIMGTQIGIPFSISLTAAVKGSLWWTILAVVMIFVLAGLLPVCRRRAGLWILVMTSIVMVPVNIRAGFLVSDYIFGEAGINAFLTFIQLSFVFESIEIILFVLLGTLLFDRGKLKGKT